MTTEICFFLSFTIYFVFYTCFAFRFSIISSGILSTSTAPYSSSGSGGAPSGNGILCTKLIISCNLWSDMLIYSLGSSPPIFILKKKTKRNEWNDLQFENSGKAASLIVMDFSCTRSNSVGGQQYNNLNEKAFSLRSRLTLVACDLEELPC